MADPLYFNGRFTTTDERVIGVEDRGFQFADAVYEVLKYIDRRPAFLREHYERLLRSLAAIEIPVPFSLEEWRGIIAELLSKASTSDGIIYLQITRGDCERIALYPDSLVPTVVCYSRRFNFPTEQQRELGVRLATIDDLRWHHCDVKTVNLLPNVLAKKHALRAGADETLFLREGFVREGGSSNFFAVLGDRVVTHPADRYVLGGIVRDRVIATALSMRIRVDERPLREDELLTLDEAFLTNTTGGVMPVREIDHRQIGNGRRGDLTAQLQTEFLRRERADAAGVAAHASK